MPFLTPLSATLIAEATGGKRDLWSLDRALVYQSKLAGRLFVVPANYVTDFASVPRMPLVYLMAGGIARQASAVHDMLYEYQLVSRKTADQIFLEAMEETGVDSGRRNVMYAGVRVFGGQFYGWRKSEEQETEKPELEQEDIYAR